MTRGLPWKSLLVALLTYLVLVAGSVLPATSEWFIGLEGYARSWRYQVRGPLPISPKVKVVGITEGTIGAFRDVNIVYPPLPRDWQALAIERLSEAGARVVVMDFLFSEKDTWDVAEDVAMRDAIVRTREQGCQVVLAAGIEDLRLAEGVTSRTLLLPAPTIMEGNPVLGLSNTQPKLSQRVIEHLALSLPLGPAGEEVEYYTQSVAAFKLACEAEGRDFAAELDRAAPGGTPFFRINYCGAPEAVSDDGPQHVYHYEVLYPELWEGGSRRDLTEAERDALKRVFADGVVFLGSRAKADNDYFSTPFGQMFGVDTNAQAFDTLYRGRLVFAVHPVTAIVLALLFALGAWGLSAVRPIVRSTLLGVLVAVVIFWANLLLFIFWRLELPLGVTVAGFILPYVTCTIYGGLTEEAAKKKIRGTFSRYVAAEIVDQIIADPQLADLGGVERNVAVLFNDIRNYSTITENLLPNQIVELLNCYFGEATEIIRRNEGFVDKYLGDGLMACFGGPVPTKDPAGDAIRAALEMIRALQDKVRPVLLEANLPVFNAGIGIHVGKVVMGNIGSESRMDYTVIGDVVNVAARVESQTKEFGWAVIVTREAKRAAGENFDYELVGTRRVKGREQPVEMYRVIDPTAPDMYRL